MGRPHQNVVVIKFYDASHNELGEEIVPLANYESSGSIYINSPEVRRSKGIRSISLRIFEDKAGAATFRGRFSFKLDGTLVPALFRRPDGSIIEP